MPSNPPSAPFAKFDIWPFNATPLQIADKIGRRASALVDALESVDAIAGRRALEEYPRSDQSGFHIVAYHSLCYMLRLPMRRMRWFADVRFWWAAERPPAFAPAAASVEGLVALAARRIAFSRAAGGFDHVLEARLVRMHCPPVDVAEVRAALWCELSAMTRRPAPQVGDRWFWERSRRRAVAPVYRPLVAAAKEHAAASLPENWDCSQSPQQVGWINTCWEASDARAVLIAARPRAPVYTQQQEQILRLLDGVAMKKEALAKALDVKPSQLYKAGYLKELKAQMRVSANRQLGGIYRLDAPPKSKPSAH